MLFLYFIYLFIFCNQSGSFFVNTIAVIGTTALVFGRGTLNSNMLSWKKLAGDATPRKECKMALDLVVLVLFFHVR